MSEAGPVLSSRVTEREYRTAMSSVPTSVVIAAAMVREQPVGMVVGTFLSMSLDPPLVGFFGDHRSSTLKPLLEGPVLSFSLLRQEDLSVCDSFRRPLPERFDGLDWAVSALGAPRLDRALTTIHAAPWQNLEVGDHTCVVAEVRDVEVHSTTARPLVFFRRRLSRLDPGHLLDEEMWQLGWQDEM